MPDRSTTTSTASRRQFLRSASVVGAASLTGVPLAAAETASPADPCETPRRSDVEAQVIARAWRDPRFKRALMESPRRVLQEVLETEIPRDVRIRVVEETEDTLYLVLPRNPSEYVDERLNEDDLSRLAMGVVNTACSSIASVQPAWFVSLEYVPER